MATINDHRRAGLTTLPPEVLSEIFLMLRLPERPRAMIPLLQTNRYLNRIGQPLLYQDLQFDWHPRFVAFAKHIANSPDQAALVRKLHLNVLASNPTGPRETPPFLNSCIGLTSVTLLYKSSGKNVEELLAGLPTDLGSFPTLKSFEIGSKWVGLPWDGRAPFAPHAQLPQLLPIWAAPKLRILKFRGIRFCGSAADTKVLKLAPLAPIELDLHGVDLEDADVGRLLASIRPVRALHLRKVPRRRENYERTGPPTEECWPLALGVSESVEELTCYDMTVNLTAELLACFQHIKYLKIEYHYFKEVGATFGCKAAKDGRRGYDSKIFISQLEHLRGQPSVINRQLNFPPHLERLYITIDTAHWRREQVYAVLDTLTATSGTWTPFLREIHLFFEAMEDHNAEWIRGANQSGYSHVLISIDERTRRGLEKDSGYDENGETLEHAKFRRDCSRLGWQLHASGDEDALKVYNVPAYSSYYDLDYAYSETESEDEDEGDDED